MDCGCSKQEAPLAVRSRPRASKRARARTRGGRSTRRALARALAQARSQAPTQTLNPSTIWVRTDTTECAGGPGANGVCTRNPSILSAIVRLAKESSESGKTGETGGSSESSESSEIAKDSALPVAPTPEAGAVRAAAAALGCDSESCVLAKMRQRRLAPEPLIRRELERSFKPPGPRHGHALLSNTNIDGVLRRWADEFPDFCPCPFAMADFDTNGDAFATADPAGLRLEGEARGAPCRTFACVHNTDVSTGPGIHWVAVFVDMRAPPDSARDWTVEYFNSAGRPPARPVVRWMERTRVRLAAVRAQMASAQMASALQASPQAQAPAAPRGGAESRAVTGVCHQRSQTECGPYALYYIRSRLEGVPVDDFANPAARISDATMEAFRQHLFRAPV